MLLDGDYPTDNALMNKIRNEIPHAGGNQCQGGDQFENPICAIVIDWYKGEKGNESLDKLGEITSVSFTGSVSGWAADAADSSKTFSVALYLNGDNKTGTKFAEVDANAAGNKAGIEGDHAFSGTLPDEALDGEEHEVYGYVLVDGKEEPMAGSPFKFIAYKPRGGEAEAMYNATVPGTSSTLTLALIHENRNLRLDGNFSFLCSIFPFLSFNTYLWEGQSRC